MQNKKRRKELKNGKLIFNQEKNLQFRFNLENYNLQVIELGFFFFLLSKVKVLFVVLVSAVRSLSAILSFITSLPII